jgi:AcrR family transcriptional regulator
MGRQAGDHRLGRLNSSLTYLRLEFMRQPHVQSLSPSRDDTDRKILAAARRLFAARGTNDVTMAEIARAAGVARGTVFNRFGSKHALVEGITENVLATYQQMLERAIEDPDTPTPGIVRDLFATMARGIEEARRLHRAVFREIAKIAVGIDQGGPGQCARQQNLERMTHLLLRGQARGEISNTHRAEDLASSLGSLINGTITHWLYDDASESLAKRMDRAAEVFLTGAIPRDMRRR